MEKLVVKMIHLISAQLQGRLFPVDTNPGSPRTWQSWKCQHAAPWQPPVPSAKDSVASMAEKISVAQVGGPKLQNPTAWMWELVRGVLQPQRGKRD